MLLTVLVVARDDKSLLSIYNVRIRRTWFLIAKIKSLFLLLTLLLFG